MQSKTLKINKEGDLVYITFPRLSEVSTIRHVFSTRHGGISTGQFSTMNLSFSSGDLPENVAENYRRLCRSVGIDLNHLVLSRQTHTNNVRKITSDDIGTGITKPSFSDVDGLITDQSGIALVTQYADCTPLLFCDPKKRVIATSHAGWRGTVSEIGSITVDKMVADYGSEREDIIVGIGPHIGQCCYEVDDPVYEAFRRLSYLNPDDIFIKKDNGKYMLSLAAVNKKILEHAGIKPENMDISDICTCCEHDHLHSHRATGGRRGNLAAIIEII